MTSAGASSPIWASAGVGDGNRAAAWDGGRASARDGSAGDTSVGDGGARDGALGMVVGPALRKVGGVAGWRGEGREAPPARAYKRPRAEMRVAALGREAAWWC
jgi:hypothetical protein